MENDTSLAWVDKTVLVRSVVERLDKTIFVKEDNDAPAPIVLGSDIIVGIINNSLDYVIKTVVDSETMHETVVEGQTLINTVNDYIHDEFEIYKVNSSICGKKFSQLSEKEKRSLLDKELHISVGSAIVESKDSSSKKKMDDLRAFPMSVEGIEQMDGLLTTVDGKIQVNRGMLDEFGNDPNQYRNLSLALRSEMVRSALSKEEIFKYADIIFSSDNVYLKRTLKFDKNIVNDEFAEYAISKGLEKSLFAAATSIYVSKEIVRKLSEKPFSSSVRRLASGSLIKHRFSANRTNVEVVSENGNDSTETGRRPMMTGRTQSECVEGDGASVVDILTETNNKIIELHRLLSKTFAETDFISDGNRDVINALNADLEKRTQTISKLIDRNINKKKESRILSFFRKLIHWS